MGGPKILMNLSNDDGKLMNVISSIKVEGQADVSSTLQLAELALKHKQNKSQRQRIVLFIGSPVSATMENTEKLQAFHEAVNNNQNSHLLSVPTGPHNLSDYLSSFPDVFGSGSGSSGGGSGGSGAVDPNIDPELAAALRMSMEGYQSSGMAEGSNDNSQSQMESGDGMDLDEDERLMQEAIQMSMMASGSTSSSEPASSETPKG